MPKTRQQKEKVLNDLIQKLGEAKGATLAVFSKLPVHADQSLRNKLHQAEISYSVIKKTLLKKALDKMGYSGFDMSGFEGNVSVAISKEDEVASARIVKDFSKQNESLIVVGGVLENKWIDKTQVEVLAKLPNKQELITKVVSTIQAPICGFVNVLAGNIRGLVNALNAIKASR